MANPTVAMLVSSILLLIVMDGVGQMGTKSEVTAAAAAPHLLHIKPFTFAHELLCCQC
jgi:hypothetical protein